ncbi:hypothetical protein [Stygiolobus azoricus]|uniref:hypothetical protein n=1 Tax=Stygiolobus azoricus TaxID=41675 RepID=UPI0012DC2FCA|nr:hypothetical protein [Stygiolobus azoricus]
MASILDNIVKSVVNDTKRYGIIGTKVTFTYVTQGTKNIESNVIYVFIPFLPPNNISPHPAYVYDLKTLRFPAYGTFNSVSGVSPWCGFISFTRTSWGSVEPNAIGLPSEDRYFNS